jgi:FKBP-type peptidyl-prolyl cis-trans isomerase FklB
MKLKLIALLSLGLIVPQADAAQSIAIDSQQVVEAPAASKNDASPATAQQQPPADANEEARLRALKGARISPREKAQLAKAEIADENIQEGANFLATNKAKKGVVVLPDGVQYKVLRAGKGKKPTDDNTVKCRYKGTLTNGTNIDKTDDKKPAALKVGGFLPGLKEAVKLMPSGSKWEIVIPPDLAYGAKGNRGVGPNAVLIYQFELVGIK